MATEKRLIDANALCYEIDCCSFETSSDYMTVCEQIAEAPTVDAVEVVHGRWKSIPASTPDGWKNSRTGEQVYPMYCSVCGDAYMNGPYKYCPSCGACMDLQ